MPALGLGTVQFGLDYGVSNQTGKTTFDEVEKIIEFASKCEIKVIDTAQAYGDSEVILGRAGIGDFKVVTKISLNGDLENSLEALRTPSVYGVLAHNAQDLVASDILWDKFLGYKQQGLVSKIGVSVYDAAQIDKILDKYNIDIIQLPLSVYDQRLLKSGHLKILKQLGVEIHVRSCFLQGLLLMSPELLPDYFRAIKEHHEGYFSFLRQYGLTPIEGALVFLKSIEEVDCIICGVNNLTQFKELAYLMKQDYDNYQYEQFACDDKSIIEPVNWRLSND